MSNLTLIPHTVEHWLKGLNDGLWYVSVRGGQWVQQQKPRDEVLDLHRRTRGAQSITYCQVWDGTYGMARTSCYVNNANPYAVIPQQAAAQAASQPILVLAESTPTQYNLHGTPNQRTYFTRRVITEERTAPPVQINPGGGPTFTQFLGATLLVGAAGSAVGTVVKLLKAKS